MKLRYACNKVVKGTFFMSIFKRCISAAAAGMLLASSLTASAADSSEKTNESAGKIMTTININGKNANTNTNSLYRGLGMVSGNNTSRLMLDYKTENPEKYWEIMNYIFGSDGIGITHLKLEMGADINSSSGTEPAVKRTEDEKADVTRGAGYQLAADAKTINPDLTLDMLWWSEPRWVSSAKDRNAARYKWYKETLDAAYETYGLKFDYVSANQNERGIDVEWIKYLSDALKSEKDCPYDYSSIKIVAADEVGNWNIANCMLDDKKLLDAVDIVGGHYNDWASEEVKELAADYGKEIWFSEGCSPMSYSQGTYRYDGTGSGLSDINGMLDIANRIITMYPEGEMTLYQFQPVVSAYYDGATYFQKQLIIADQPWSGYYTLDTGFYMSLHFSQFFKKGWSFIDSACYADGVAGGDGHAIVDAEYSYMTASDLSTGDYSTVITNTTDHDITYQFEVSNLDKASAEVEVRETRGPDDGAYDENYFVKSAEITPEEKDGKYVYSVTVKPYSLITVSTLSYSEKEFASPEKSEQKFLELPYEDDFEYKDYDKDYLSSRGGAPRYTTDEGGAFEVENIDGNNVLVQKITEDMKAVEWGRTPDPVTNFGDDSWYNYSVSTDVKFAASEKPEDNYTGVGLRYNLADMGTSGYWLKVYENGAWQLMQNNMTLTEGTLDGFDGSAWNNLKIEAVDNIIRGYINGTQIAEFDGAYTAAKTGEKKTKPVHGAGRAALYSAYCNNCFDNLKIDKAGENDNYVVRIDDTDAEVSYSGEWTHTTMGSFKCYNRTVSQAAAGSSFELKFQGTGFAVLGAVKDDCKINVEIDGEIIESGFTTLNSLDREISYYKTGLSAGEHTAKITVLSGEFNFDAAEILGNYTYKDMKSLSVPKEATPEKQNDSQVKKYAAAAIAIVAAAGIAAFAIIKKKRRNK